MTPPRPRVFLIDDDELVRSGVGRLLRTAGFECDVFPSAADFLARESHSGPACLVVDVRMPGLSGLELQQSLLQRGREEQLIFITGHGDVPMCTEAMKAGALDFLLKPVGDEQLLECVKRALTRSAEQRKLRANKNDARRLLDSLTPREFEVMQLVVTGMLNKQIAAELKIAETTVKVHRGRIMRKLHVSSAVELAELVRVGGASVAKLRQ